MPIVRTEAGSGGRKGHSNMAHYDPTAIVKAKAKKARRAAAKALVNEED